MATKEKRISPEKSNASEDWTVVLPRGGKKARPFSNVMIPEQLKQKEPWTPSDVDTDTVRESTLMQNMEEEVPVSMAAKERVLSPEISNPAEEGWTIVLPRRGKKARRFMTSERPKQDEPWAPTDVETDTARESSLMLKMEISIQKLEQTEFCRSYFDQIESPEILEKFLKVLGMEEKMQMVIYGIGSIESYETPRIQLSLAILMKRKFDWIGEIEVFDPVLLMTESRVLTSLGCSVLSVNEQCHRKVVKPMMFFMPHCEAELYENLLEANWKVDRLTNVLLFGNSFELQEEGLSVFNSSTVKNLRKHILASRSFTEELKVKTFSDDSFQAFHSSSWHFFSSVSEADLHAVK